MQRMTKDATWSRELLQFHRTSWANELCLQKNPIIEVKNVKTTLEYKNEFLCVVEENDSPTGFSEWRPVRKAEYKEVQTLLGRPVMSVDQREGIYGTKKGTPISWRTRERRSR